MTWEQDPFLYCTYCGQRFPCGCGAGKASRPPVSGESLTPTPYAVLCTSEHCGPPHDLTVPMELWRARRVFLTPAEYTRQMDNPDARWICPRCGAEAEWDDETYERAMEAGDAPPR